MVLGNPVEISEPRTREFFSPLSGLEPPLQVALKEASSAIRGVDLMMRSQVDGPRRVDRFSYGNFIDHFSDPLRTIAMSITHAILRCFLLFPEHPFAIDESRRSAIGKGEVEKQMTSVAIASEVKR